MGRTQKNGPSLLFTFGVVVIEVRMTSPATREIVLARFSESLREIPRSGTPKELLERYGISARAIVDAVKGLVKL